MSTEKGNNEQQQDNTKVKVHVDLILCSKCQIDGEDFVNLCGLFRKHELDGEATPTSHNCAQSKNCTLCSSLFFFFIMGSRL